VGWGQAKVVGKELLGDFFFGDDNASQNRLPNAIADLLSSAGYVGILLKLGLLLWLFFKSRAHRNYFRTALFLFMMIYQFTGSCLGNLAEYVVFAFALSPAFPEFEVAPSSQRNEVLVVQPLVN
jgi:hypothetical protein